MAAYYVGLDVHSRESVFAITDQEGTVVGRGTVPTNPEGLASLQVQYRLPTGTTVALETGTTSFYVARELARLHLTPIVIDAHEVRLKAHRPQHKSATSDSNYDPWLWATGVTFRGWVERGFKDDPNFVRAVRTGP